MPGIAVDQFVRRKKSNQRIVLQRGRETWRKERRETDRERSMGREETRGSDSESMMRREKKKREERKSERVYCERESRCQKLFVSYDYRGYGKR